MDPTATWRTVKDRTEDDDSRAVAAVDLLAWLALRGFMPDTGEMGDGRGDVVDTCTHRIFQALDALAAHEEGT